MKKRSVKIAGHATSITLENEFWDALKSIATHQKKSLNTLITHIDKKNAGENLSSAIRVFILKEISQTTL